MTIEKALLEELFAAFVEYRKSPENRKAYRKFQYIKMEIENDMKKIDGKYKASLYPVLQCADGFRKLNIETISAILSAVGVEII